jgi:hypothetical protein
MYIYKKKAEGNLFIINNNNILIALIMPNRKN